MSDPAAVEFISCLRRGAATLIDGPVDLGTQRIALDVGLHFNDSLEAKEKIELYGPGEITGFDARAVTRTWPGKNVMDADTSSLAHIEFDQPDLPWRYSPFPVARAVDQITEHVLSFEKFKGLPASQLPLRQQFSDNGAWWQWRVTPQPMLNNSMRLIGLVQPQFVGSVDFDEPVISVVMQSVGTANLPAFPGDAPWVPTLVLEGFHNNTVVQSVDIPLDGMHLGAFTLTAPEANAMTRMVMRVITPPPLPPPSHLPRVEFEVFSITYATAAKSFAPPDGLRPWCVLIVLRPEEILAYRPAASPGSATQPSPVLGPNGQPVAAGPAAESLPLPLVKTRRSLLPDLSQSWAWAHAQVSGPAEITEPAVLDLFEHAPQRMLSRIICPRRLVPGVPYRAFLVPAFERGRLAGLGLPLEFMLQGRFTGTVSAALPAWDPAHTVDDVELPVYYEWAFQTAAGVDFESLARALKAKPLPPEVGARPVDVSEPDAALPPAARAPLWIEGALQAAAPAHDWKPGQRARFIAALARLLNTPKALLGGNGAATVAPPIYGRWLQAEDSVDPASAAWLDTLNVDPRNRIASGAGGEVIHRNEEQILEGAWRQIEGFPEINETLRHAQLARTIARRLRERRLAALNDDAFLLMYAPLFRRVNLGAQTIAKLVAGSPIGRGPFEPVFRRVLQRLARRRTFSGKLLDRMNRGEIAAARWPAMPSLLLMTDQASSAEVRNAPFRPFFSLVFEVGPGHPPPPAPPPVAGSVDLAAMFRTAAVAMFDGMNAARTKLPQPVPLRLADIRQRLAASTDPEAAVTSLQSRLHIAAGFPRAAADPLEPILASPEFDQPMYEPLRDLSEEWILPGLAAFPSNTISLAVVNRPFIEAYMLGLSHALSRSLLWRGFPTDQRGTHFRQFWDPRGYFGPRTREELRNIPAIDTWLPANALGMNSSSPPLVLLLRGDLLRQYPTAIVYATRATRVNGRREPLQPADERHPVFRGRLGGDIAFFGFELTAAEARGDASDEGWFFVLQEQPNEPRFDPETGSTAPDWQTFTGSTSAIIAKSTLHQSVRVVLHASGMLPEE